MCEREQIASDIMRQEQIAARNTRKESACVLLCCTLYCFLTDGGAGHPPVPAPVIWLSTLHLTELKP